MPNGDPFPTVTKLAVETESTWAAYEIAANGTAQAESKLKSALNSSGNKGGLLSADASLVLF